uniref:Uncharacterized protein n=1 Tax=viral metagenome TaxID=1070528 RepID=A0A6M3LAY0_9ZZZZ
MAAIVWKGGATAVAQVNTEQPALMDIADTFTIVLTDYQGFSDSITYTAAAATAKDVVEGLMALAVAAKAAGAYGWKDVTCTENDVLLTITADTAGQPFYVTASSVGGTLTDASVTACAGNNIATQNENWVGGTAPADGDSIVIPADAAYDIYGADMTDKEIVGFTIEEGCTIDIGARNKPLALDLTYSAAAYDANLAGIGTQFLNLTNTDAVNITESGSAPGDGQYSKNLRGDAVSVTVACADGESVGIAGGSGEAMTITTLTINSGDVTIAAAVAPTTINVNGGTVFYHSTGTATTVNIGPSGTVDKRNTLNTCTFTNVNMFAGAKLYDPYKTITLTNGVDLEQCGIEDVTLELGKHITVTPSAV